MARSGMFIRCCIGSASHECRGSHSPKNRGANCGGFSPFTSKAAIPEPGWSVLSISRAFYSFGEYVWGGL